MFKIKGEGNLFLYFQQRELSPLFSFVFVPPVPTVWLLDADVYGGWVGWWRERGSTTFISLIPCFVCFCSFVVFLMFLNVKLGTCWPSHDLKWLQPCKWKRFLYVCSSRSWHADTSGNGFLNFLFLGLRVRSSQINLWSVNATLVNKRIKLSL